MVTEDGPHFANWDQDATAVEDRYDLQDPAVVSVEIMTAASTLADRFDAVRDDQWDRPGFPQQPSTIGSASGLSSLTTYTSQGVPAGSCTHTLSCTA